MYPPVPMWQQPLYNVTNTYQQQGGTCRKHGGDAKRKHQQQQHQCQHQCQQQYQHQIQPITNKYCWNHGGCNHFGSNCKYPAQGHQNKATFQNKMGGSMNNWS
eukprot:15340080-Ditylum_brightwellii.AAC.1